MERWQQLINYLDMTAECVQAIASIVSVYLLIKGYNLAKDFAGQHKQKLKLEREDRYAEKILELLKKIDLEVNALFHSNVLNTETGQEEIVKMDEALDKSILERFPSVRRYHTIHLTVKLNRETKLANIFQLSRQIDFYIGYFESSKLIDDKLRMIIAVKDLVSWVVEDFPKLAAEKFDRLEDYRDHFDRKIVLNFPDSMFVSVPYVTRYQKHRDQVANELFSIIKPAINL